jgi:hypothetical protein
MWPAASTWWLRRAGLTADETARISGHSTRVGSAQDMLRYGEQLPSIVQAGCWKTAEMVARYTAKQGTRVYRPWRGSPRHCRCAARASGRMA